MSELLKCLVDDLLQCFYQQHMSISVICICSYLKCLNYESFSQKSTDSWRDLEKYLSYLVFKLRKLTNVRIISYVHRDSHERLGDRKITARWIKITYHVKSWQVLFIICFSMFFGETSVFSIRYSCEPHNKFT